MLSNVFTNVDFELFKSEVCHRIKEHGELSFIEETLIDNDVEKYWNMENYLCAFYLLAMLDYLLKKNGIPLYNKYNYIRQQKMSERVYPYSAVLLKNIVSEKEVEDNYIKDAIPEFLQYNIVEGDIFNVC